MLQRLRVHNFKCWRDTGPIEFKPITAFFGSNSSGKSSLFQALLLMKQTEDSSDRGLHVFHFGDQNTLVDLGDYQGVVHGHDTTRSLGFSLTWLAKMGFEVPARHGAGHLEQGTDLALDVLTNSGLLGSEQSSILESMCYQFPDQRQFGISRRMADNNYDIFVSESGSDRERHTIAPPSFPPSIKCGWFPYWSCPFVGHAPFFDLSYELKLFLDSVQYLGPLRARPSRIYARSGAHPSDVGKSGESMIDAILSSQERSWAITPSSELAPATIDEHVSMWLRRLRLADKLKVKRMAGGSKWFEIEIRKTSQSASVALTDVGIGVSQILPVLVLCFHVDPGSTVILEQPEIHLHPSAQAGLGDVFIDAWQQRGVQVLVESHSEHLLRRLQRRLAEGRIEEDDVALYFCSTDEGGQADVTKLEVDGLGNIANWPKDFFGDQFGEIAAMSDAALKRMTKE